MIEFTSKKQADGHILHTLKCVEPFYYEVEWGRKTFEIRKDDREFPYQAGDSLALYQVKDRMLTGAWIVRKVIYVLRDAPEYSLQPGYVIMAIK